MLRPEPETMIKPAQSVPVYRSDDFTVTDGANLGDGINIADDLSPDDIYGLSADAERVRLSLVADGEGGFSVGEDTEVGHPGAVLHFDCCCTFMARDGVTTEVLILVELDTDGMVDEVYALPLAPLQPKTDYALVGVDTDTPQRKLAEVACVSFTRGTLITMMSGAQRPIEDLQVGDKVLTRDDGPQEIRWIGQTTARAVGAFAPIVITAGTLNNENDLIVSPDHRLFIYQRQDRLGAGRSELLVKARHLVNGTSIYHRDGGFVDYFQLLFDDHQIIYAEGIAAESMLVDTHTRAMLPDEVARAMSAELTGHRTRPHLSFEVQESLLDRPDAAELLRRASTR